MNSDLSNQLGCFVFSGGIAYVLWRTYKNPSRDRVTRWLYRYFDFWRPWWYSSTEAVLWHQVVICGAVAFFCLMFAVAEVSQIFHAK